MQRQYWLRILEKTTPMTATSRDVSQWINWWRWLEKFSVPAARRLESLKA
jgi:hypothetical protein